MTVKRLIELLQDAPPDMPVYVCIKNDEILGFAEACECETGECELGPPPDDIYNKEQIKKELIRLNNQTRVFVILPHGFNEYPDDDPEHLLN